MNKTNLSDRDRTLAAGFALQRGLEGMAQVSAEDTPVLYNDIFKYVLGVDSGNDSKIEASLACDLGVRRIYLDLLKERRKFYMPRAAAAASNEIIKERDSENFYIKLVSSRSQTSQFYVILILKSLHLAEDGSELVLHVTNKDKCARCNFPPLQDGRTQVVVDEKDCLYDLLTAMDAEIYIH
jgi:hypothetical protein